MIIELHVHGRPHKHQGNSKLMQIAEIAKSQGTDCLVLTEHTHTKDYGIWNDRLIGEVEQKHGIKIYVGAEIRTKQYGDILEIGDAKIWAHPMRSKFPFDVWEGAKGFLDAVEVMNKSYTMAECIMALENAHEHDLAVVGGSDIHLNRHVGICPCWIPSIENLDVIAWHIKKGNCVPLKFANQ